MSILLGYGLMSVAVVFIWCGCGGGTTAARDGDHAWTRDFEGFKAIEGIDFIHLIKETAKDKSCLYNIDSEVFSCTIRFDVPKTVAVELGTIADGLQHDIDANREKKFSVVYRYSSAVGENNNQYLVFLVKRVGGCFRIASVVNHEGVETGYDWVKDVKHLYFPEKQIETVSGQFVRMGFKYSVKSHNQYFGPPETDPLVFLAFELERCPGERHGTTSAYIRFNSLKYKI